MEPPSSNLLHLIRLCAVRKEAGSEAWSQLLREIDGLARSGFARYGSARDMEEFVQQFPGWLFRRDKLSMVEMALRKKIDAGEVSGLEQEEHFAKNYLARIIKSAVAEFYREFARHDDTHAADLLQAASSERPGDDRMQDIVAELLKLPMRLRVPFRLRHYAALGPLLEDEMQFIEEQSGLPRPKAAELIESEFQKNNHRDFPLSSAFIGQLIGITDDDPKSNVVNQRIRRAQLRLVENLRGGR